METAIWSAIAASFSALASFLIMFIHWQNLEESVRPELFLLGWSREPEQNKEYEVLSCKIKNVGRGAALDVFIHKQDSTGLNPLIVVFPVQRLSVVATNETIDLNPKIIILWPNVVDKIAPDDRFITIKILINCWDSRGTKHEFEQKLHVFQHKYDVGGANMVAPGMMLEERRHIIYTMWWLKMRQNLKRIPLIGNLIKIR